MMSRTWMDQWLGGIIGFSKRRIDFVTSLMTGEVGAQKFRNGALDGGYSFSHNHGSVENAHILKGNDPIGDTPIFD